MVLHDIDPDALRIVGALASALLARGGNPFVVRTTTSLEEAVEGTSFIITSIRVGGLAGRIVDEQVPLAYGVLGQETTGPGGWAMALRTIPVLTALVARNPRGVDRQLHQSRRPDHAGAGRIRRRPRCRHLRQPARARQKDRCPSEGAGVRAAAGLPRPQPPRLGPGRLDQ